MTTKQRTKANDTVQYRCCADAGHGVPQRQYISPHCFIALPFGKLTAASRLWSVKEQNMSAFCATGAKRLPGDKYSWIRPPV